MPLPIKKLAPAVAGQTTTERIQSLLIAEGRSTEEAEQIAQSLPLIEAAIARGDDPRKVLEKPMNRRAGRKKKEPIVPPLPSGLTWPTETYSKAHEAFGEDIVAYLDRVWLPLTRTGVVTLAVLRARDKSAAEAINNYSRPDAKTGERKRLPARLDIPTAKEANDRALAADPELAQRDPRLAQVVVSRAIRRLKSERK